MTQLTIYTIGHSDHATEDLIALLASQGIDVLVDVRSQPYSRWVPQFNRESLEAALPGAGLRYVWQGDALGGRPRDPSLYDGDSARPDYARVRETADYQHGIDDLLALAGDSVVAIMCSEGDYRQCHRSLLITPSLVRHDVRVVHILPDGRAVEAEEEPEQLSLF
jgi:uncharacterized protein (DUF488 family)